MINSLPQMQIVGPEHLLQVMTSLQVGLVHLRSRHVPTRSPTICTTRPAIPFGALKFRGDWFVHHWSSSWKLFRSLCFLMNRCLRTDCTKRMIDTLSVSSRHFWQRSVRRESSRLLARCRKWVSRRPRIIDDGSCYVIPDVGTEFNL